MFKTLKSARYAFCLLTLVTLSGCADDMPRMATTTLEAPSESNYLLDTGDKVKVTTFREETLSGEFKVDDNGSLSFPLIGVVQAKGLTARNLEKTIREKLAQGFLKDPQVTVQVLSYRPFYILGEVKSPGSYPYVTAITIENAVALAGGYSYRGRKDVAIISRAASGGAEVTVPVTTKVIPGDVITIKERYF